MRWTSVVLLVLIAATACGDEAALRVQQCHEGHIPPDARIEACTWLIESGRLDDYQISRALNNRGLAYHAKGLYDRAIEDYDEAVRFDHRNANAFSNRGHAYEKNGAPNRAAADYVRAREVFDWLLVRDPGRPDLYLFRGVSYHRRGLLDQAIADYDEAIRLSRATSRTPEFVMWAYMNRGLAHHEQGRMDQVIADYEAAISLGYRQVVALNALAWVLATAPEAQVRDGERAVSLAERAVGLNDTWFHRDTLAAALAEAGRFKDAAREQQTAIDRLREAGGDDEMSKMTMRLELYRAGQPFRE